MSAINFQNNPVSGAGDGAGDGALGSVGAPASLYRTRGTIDLSLGRVPNVSDISIAVLEVLYPNDVFVVTTQGTPVSGVTGVTALMPGDYMLYVGGDVTLAASWCGVTNPARLGTQFPNCPPGFVNIIARRGDAND